ncbi:MAG TPA: LemA family protein [Patescibacteria group bacterium]|nr:LemA family protein [Patescibacteria group bacterium]
MNLFLIILLVIVVGIGLWLMSTYNFFAQAKVRINAAVQEIGNQLKRQADLIPNLEASAKGYLTHEKEVYKMLTDARKAVAGAVGSGNLQKMSDAGAQLNAVLPKLSIAVESNPELKANTLVQNLMDELRDTADKIMYSRRLLIDLTADFNSRRVTFPTNIIANMMNVQEMKGLITPTDGEFLNVSDADTQTPKVSL